ncbi:MAG: HEAT repeat domain-containing protein [FCB group bacterium]|nr:HEAT repeat domain-containing protein [FCB group bacterium]
MNKLLTIFLAGLLLFSACSKVKQLTLFGKKKGYGELMYSDIEKLRMAYQDGRIQALEELISIYNDANQPFDVRIAAGKALAETQHPTALNAIAKVVANADAMDITFMEASIELLAEFRENPKAPEAMVQAMHNVENKSNQLYMTLVKYLNKVRTKDQLLALLDLYEVARANLSRTEKLLTETLGALGNEEVIPVLLNIAKDPNVSIGVRNRAVEILGKKKSTEIIGAFTELLGDPTTNLEVRDFALNTLAGVKEEKLILTLLDTYNTGKKQYYSLLNTLMDALGDFDDPEVKLTLSEIALNNDYPLSLRKKAIRKLGQFNDPSVIDKLLPLLGDAKNYRLYRPIYSLIEDLGVTDRYSEERRRLAFRAHKNAIRP